MRTTALWLLALCLAVTPASPEDFHPPGKYALHYGVEWRLIRAGVVRVNWESSGGGNHAELHMESAGMVSKLYRVNDNYRAQMGLDLCGKSVLFDAEEGKRKRQTKISFDAAGKVSYLERDLLKNSVLLSKELATPPCVYEYLGGLHRIRSLKLEPGQSTTLPLTDGKKFANVKVEAQEREQVRTPLGTFNTVRYEVYMFNDVIIPKKARMNIWITDDAKRLPVQLRIRMQFLIGTITLQLEKEEAL